MALLYLICLSYTSSLVSWINTDLPQTDYRSEQVISVRVLVWEDHIAKCHNPVYSLMVSASLILTSSELIIPLLFPSKVTFCVLGGRTSAGELVERKTQYNPIIVFCSGKSSIVDYAHQPKRKGKMCLPTCIWAHSAGCTSSPGWIWLWGYLLLWNFSKSDFVNVDQWREDYYEISKTKQEKTHGISN